jgi:hypothetical protein
LAESSCAIRRRESFVHHQDFDDLSGFDDLVALGLPLYFALNGESHYGGWYP